MPTIADGPIVLANVEVLCGPDLLEMAALPAAVQAKEEGGAGTGILCNHIAFELILHWPQKLLDVHRPSSGDSGACDG